MTLFISCLLIYHYDMDPWWYVVATVLYVGHLAMLNEQPAQLFHHFKQLLARLFNDHLAQNRA